MKEKVAVSKQEILEVNSRFWAGVEKIKSLSEEAFSDDNVREELKKVGDDTLKILRELIRVTDGIDYKDKYGEYSLFTSFFTVGTLIQTAISVCVSEISIKERDCNFVNTTLGYVDKIAKSTSDEIKELLEKGVKE